MLRELNVAVSMTDECDLDCIYCSEGGPGENTMPIETFKTLIQKIDDSSILDKIVMFWHGGEPSQPGLDYFKEVVDVQNSSRVEYKNYAQFNGVLLDKEWIKFLKKEDFGVGISVDGPKDIHDRQRPYKESLGGGPSFDRVMDSIILMDDLKLDFNIMAVITRIGIDRPKEIFDFFSQYKGVINLKPMEPVGKGKDIKDLLGITPVEFSGFLENIFYMMKETPQVKINPFYSKMGELKTGTLFSCSTHKSCSDHYIFVTANGDVSPCGLENIEKFRYGNIQDISIESILNSDIRKNIAKLRNNIEECNVCIDYDLCGGGCLASSYSIRGRIDDKDKSCHTRKTVINLIKQELKGYKSNLKEAA